MEPCVCTEEFRTETVVVVDSAGVPLDDVQVTVRRLAGDSVLAVPQNPVLGSGVYAVIDDGFKDALSPSGEIIRFHGVRGSEMVQADFMMGVDDCRCHILKISGPDTLRFGS